MVSYILIVRKQLRSISKTRFLNIQTDGEVTTPVGK